jgi:hypothetical protein
MNTKDPLKLNNGIKGDKIPNFGAPGWAILKIRVRCQPKGGGDYQFAMTLQFSGVRHSPYNIGPIVSPAVVQIDKRALFSDKNKPLLDQFEYEEE